jgi:hypothetical protein
MVEVLSPITRKGSKAGSNQPLSPGVPHDDARRRKAAPVSELPAKPVGRDAERPSKVPED